MKATDHSLTNANGMQARISSYGATVRSLIVPDRHGEYADVVLGYDTVDGYIGGKAYLGATVGRYANRISGAGFELDGRRYALPANDGPNTLHGGFRGFDKVVWTAGAEAAGRSVRLTYVSPDGEQGFPGDVTVRVTYTLTDHDELRIDYDATTDRATPLNLSNHAYFNLAGHGAGDVLGHEVEIVADTFTPVDTNLIPTGELRGVEGSPFDFLAAAAIGARIADDDRQLAYAHGYDHNFVLRRTGAGLELAARIVEPDSGRVLEVLTTEPGVQFYTGNHLDGFAGKGGRVYGVRSGFCMETQHFPDSPNRPDFPDTILRPGESYASTTVYRFSARMDS